MKKTIETTLDRSRSIPDAMKEKIRPLLLSSTRYQNKMFLGLRKPSGLTDISSKASGCSFGADAKGFFVYTHRARCKSYSDWKKIPKKDINFIESTG